MQTENPTTGYLQAGEPETPVAWLSLLSEAAEPGKPIEQLSPRLKAWEPRGSLAQVPESKGWKTLSFYVQGQKMVSQLQDRGEGAGERKNLAFFCHCLLSGLSDNWMVLRANLPHTGSNASLPGTPSQTLPEIILYKLLGYPLIYSSWN